MNETLKKTGIGAVGVLVGALGVMGANADAVTYEKIDEFNYERKSEVTEVVNVATLKEQIAILDRQISLISAQKSKLEAELAEAEKIGVNID